jgi:hypothetical protein
MTPLDVEVRARELLELTKTRPIGEDSRVECKATWVEPAEMAPALAAMANAARGEPVFILIGVNRDGSICGAPANELADWLQRLEARFDEVSPRAWPDVRLNFDEGTVHVLAFDTSAAPYIVRPLNAPDRWAFLIRRGTRVFDVRRAEVLAMLLPTSRLPQIEITGAYLCTQTFDDIGLATALCAQFYIGGAVPAWLALPSHRMKGSLRLGERWHRLAPMRFYGRSSGATGDAGGAVIDGAGSVELRGYARPAPGPADPIQLLVEMESAGGVRWRIEAELMRVDDKTKWAILAGGPYAARVLGLREPGMAEI